FWSYALPPLFLLFGWMIYDQVDDKLRAKAGELYDAVQSKVSGSGKKTASASAPASETRAARDELNDGLTPEQRRMLD
ncbi:hypothetical protein HER21_50450, partial [Pseudomonas sp. BGM005]|nr:hypothetical protein [Pseudomonas sp. BG5]